MWRMNSSRSASDCFICAYHRHNSSCSRERSKTNTARESKININPPRSRSNFGFFVFFKSSPQFCLYLFVDIQIVFFDYRRAKMCIAEYIKEFIRRNQQKLKCKFQVVTLELLENINDIFLCDVVSSCRLWKIFSWKSLPEEISSDSFKLFWRDFWKIGFGWIIKTDVCIFSECFRRSISSACNKIFFIFVDFIVRSIIFTVWPFSLR